MNWGVFWGAFLGVFAGAFLTQLLWHEHEEDAEPATGEGC